MEVIEFEKLKLDKYDAESALKFIKDKINKEEYRLIINEKSVIEELIDLLVDNRIEFRFDNEKNCFSLNLTDRLKKILTNTIMGPAWEYNYIEHIDVRYLFGYLKYSLKFKDNLLVVQAPNGYGKSTLLKFINYFYSRDYDELFSLPFYEFSLTFDDEGSLYDRKKTVIVSFINGDDRFIKHKDDRHIVFIKYDSNLVEEHIKYLSSIQNYVIIHNTDDFEKNLEVSVFNRGNGGYGKSKEIFEKSIDLFNECIKVFLDNEKKIYLKKEYKMKDKDILFSFKDSLVIKNNMKPLKMVGSIIRKDEKMKFEQLSSGEQYIIYLLYMLTVYMCNPLNDVSLYIIDEPELNLHVEWQQLLIDTIVKLIDNKRESDPYTGDKSSKFIITTHSPYIIIHPGINVGGPEYETE